MKKTVQVSIGRKPFTIDDDAYEIIQGYLERAKSRLHTDPDKDEILTDLEMAMAGHLHDVSENMVVDKASAQKTVELMGEVEQLGSEEEPRAHKEKQHKNSETRNFADNVRKILRKPIYKDHDREVLDGVCAGIARILDIDPLWVRLLFVIVTITSYGVGGVVLYFVLMLVMKDKDQTARTADDVVGEVKEKLQEVSPQLRAFEKSLRTGVRQLFTVVKFVLGLLAFFVLAALAAAWSTALFFMLSNPSKIVLFGQQPAWTDFIAVISVGLVLLVPLFVLITQLAGSKLARSVRFTVATWCIWTLALLIGVGSLANSVPDINARLLREKPRTRNVLVEVHNGSIVHSCLTLWGDCRSNEPNIYAKSLCGKELRFVSDTSENMQQMQAWSWSYYAEPIAYPVNANEHCAAVERIIEDQKLSEVVFQDQDLNAAQYISLPNPSDSDCYRVQTGLSLSAGNTAGEPNVFSEQQYDSMDMPNRKAPALSECERPEVQTFMLGYFSR